MSNEQKNKKQKYDLEDRTAVFGENIIVLATTTPKNEIIRPIIHQLVKCGTSVGANYCEADDAESKKDFKHKIGICKKESREYKHFLRMLAKAVPHDEKLVSKCRELWNEARELNLIFNSIYRQIKTD